MSEAIGAIFIVSAFVAGIFVGWIVYSVNGKECAPDNHKFRQLNGSNAFVCRACGKKIAP